MCWKKLKISLNSSLLIVLHHLDSSLLIRSLPLILSYYPRSMCQYFALEGLGKLLNTIKIVQTRLNPELDIEGILLTMYDSRLRLSNQVVEEVKTHFQQMVFNTIIQRNTKLGEAPSFGQTIIMHDASSKGSVNYLNLARDTTKEQSHTQNQERR